MNEFNTSGKPEGYWEQCYQPDNIKLWKKGHYKNGLMDGIWIFYHSNGNYWGSGLLTDDEVTGIWLIFSDDGEFKWFGHYKNRKEYKLWKKINLNNELLEKIFYLC